MSKLVFLIPAFNEEEAIADVIKDIRKETKKLKLNSDIVVIDDGSSDKTSSISRKAGAHVITHVLNTGSGGATSTGLAYANKHKYDYAVTLDADGQHTAKDALAGYKLAKMQSVDLMLGSRLIDSQGMSRAKVVGNKGLTALTYFFYGVKVTDSQSGLRIFSAKALRKLRWQSHGFEFCSEMLWRAKQKNLFISEYPIEAIYTDYSMSKGQNNWNAFTIVKSLIKRRIIEGSGE